MKEYATEMKGEVKETIATLITTAFGLIAALAWNEAIKALITQFLGQVMNSPDFYLCHINYYNRVMQPY